MLDDHFRSNNSDLEVRLIEHETSVSMIMHAVSYTHLTLPTNREV